MHSPVSTVSADQLIEDLKRELKEAHRRETTTAEILRIISSSPTNMRAVLDMVAASAARLCDAHDATIHQVDGVLLRLVAHHGPILTGPTMPLARGALVGRAVLERQAIQIADLSAEKNEYPEGSESARRLGFRTTLAVPLIRAGNALGVISIRRTEVRPFADRQIELLKTFADQAVIAIENARLFEAEQARTRQLTERTHELTEALEYQTGASDVLNTISRSPNELQPVLNTIAETAARICKAQVADIAIVEGDNIHIRASFGEFGRPLGESGNAARTARATTVVFSLDRGTIPGRAVLDKVPVHVPDLQSSGDDFCQGREFARKYGHRAIVGVPLMREDRALGALLLRRSEPGPFSAQQIALLQTFADQAVIAIENTRLFEAEQTRTRELTESLEYQTATNEVLSVISRSPSQLQPVFDFIAHSASRLCGDEHAIVTRYDGEDVHLVAQHNPRPGTLSEVANFYPVPAAPNASVSARAIATGSLVHIPDIEAEAFELSILEYYSRISARALIGVPMIHQGRPIGSIAVSRATPGPFSKRQIDLLQTFADQAVIAIENARLFDEVETRTRELTQSLEYQTATSDVLSVISRSPNELLPVLDSIVVTARKLCQAENAFILRLRRSDGMYHVAAANSDSPEMMAYVQAHPAPPGRNSISGRVALERRPVHVTDVLSDPELTYVDSASEFTNTRTRLGVPLLQGGEVIGVLVVSRHAMKPFADRQIELVTTFANQAVIAIENARLFEEVQTRNSELRVALGQQTATSELLKVIGQSTFDLQPVFETLAESAVRLCDAERSLIYRLDAGKLRVVASYNATVEVMAFLAQNPMPLARASAAGRASLERRTIHIEDVLADPEYTYGATQVDPVRTVLAIPMLKTDELLGVIVIYRQEVRPFTASHISLMETFADQAVIAIENTRLFEEVQARNRDLTALGEVGRAVSSTLDLKLVLKTIVGRAVELSGTDAGSIFYYREGGFELGETTGLDDEVIARFRKLDISTGQTGLGEALERRQPLQVPDIFNRPSNPLRDAAVEAGLRAGLIVPLLGGKEPLGALVLQRRQPGEFPQAVISLMQSFADQSAIALENARLFEEIAQKSRELEIASQHKSQFVANMSHELRTPLAAILGYAELIQEGFYGPQPEKSTDALTRIRSNGNHLLSLINTVLDIAKIESGQFKLNLGEYALENVVETVRVATESLAENRKLSLQTVVAKRLPLGLGDEQRLTQVLLNLVGNAIKFTEAGEVRITAAAVNGHFSVRVIDTGPGISPEEQKRVFEKFHQVDNSNTKAKGGTGLGLAIAKQIVEMHGGRIWVESAPGKGATFQMHLPIRAEEANGTT